MAKPTNSTPLVDLHPTLHNIHVDVKMYGAVGDGTTDDTSAVAAAITAAGAGGQVDFPAGTYKIADSSSLAMLANQIWMGVGERSSYLTSKNAYAITAISLTGTQTIEKLGFGVRSGATTGGAFKLDSGTVIMRDVEVNSQNSCTDPAIYLKGTIGSYLERVSVLSPTAHGIRADATGTTLAFNNENRYVHCTVHSVQGSTNAGIYSEGGGGNRFLGGDVESNRGYGIHLYYENHDTIEGIWFEDNSNHNVLIDGDSFACQVNGNKFHGQHAGIGTADHVNIATVSSSLGQTHAVAGNHFQDASNSGVAIRIGANVENTYIASNRKASFEGGTIVDGGIRTISIPGNTSVDEGVRFNTWLQIPESSSVAAGPTNTARLFCYDTGGKTRLAVLFPTGAAITIATEP